MGDVNLDGDIDISDCTAIQRHLAGLKRLADDQFDYADLDGNSIVDINDVTLLQKYLAGFKVEFAQK